MEKYKYLLKCLKRDLKEYDFLKKEENFYYKNNINWGVIAFQRSRSNFGNVTKFTINIGVQSTVLAQEIDGILDRPLIEDCHWNQRIGFLLPQKKDYWWSIDQETSIDDLVKEIFEIIKEIVMPYLRLYMQDDNLIEEWIKNNSPGQTELDRYIYLTTLLKIRGDERLMPTIEKLLEFSKNKRYESFVKNHVKELFS